MLVSINLTQFPNYKECPKVESFIDWADFFARRSAVLSYSLFIEESEEYMDCVLTRLKEASGLDFNYKTYKAQYLQTAIDAFEEKYKNSRKINKLY